MKLTNVFRSAYMIAVLAAGAALTMTANIANAKGDHHRRDNAQSNRASPNFAISGQPVGVKKVLRDRKDCKKNCEKPTLASGKPSQTTTQGGVTAPQFVVSGQPASVKSVSGGSTSIATISNGVTSSAIFNGKGSITVTAATPTSITVTNSDHSSVTLGGETVTLSGARSIQTGPGMEVHRLQNGDVTISIKPTVASAPARPAPSGVTPVDDIKAVGQVPGKVGSVVGNSPVVVGVSAHLIGAGAVIATIAGEPIRGTKQIANDVVNSAGAALDWVSGWF